MRSERTINKTLIDSNIVSFFDLLAKFDFEDKQRETSTPVTDSLDLTPSKELVSGVEENSDSTPAVSAIRSNNLALTKTLKK